MTDHYANAFIKITAMYMSRLARKPAPGRSRYSYKPNPFYNAQLFPLPTRHFLFPMQKLFLDQERFPPLTASGNMRPIAFDGRDEDPRKRTTRAAAHIRVGINS